MDWSLTGKSNAALFQKLNVYGIKDAREKKIREPLQSAKGKINNRIKAVIAAPEIRQRVEVHEGRAGGKWFFGLALPATDIRFEFGE